MAATGRLLDVGIRPSLSIDVCSSNGGDMFGAMRSTIAAQRGMDNLMAEQAGQSLVEEVRLSCRDVVSFATIDGARACGLDDRIGSLTPGKQADVIAVSTKSLALTPMNNPWGALVYAAHPGLVETILVAGRIVKRDGQLLDADLDHVRELAFATREHLLAQAGGDAAIADARLGGNWRPQQLRAQQEQEAAEEPSAS